MPKTLATALRPSEAAQIVVRKIPTAENPRMIVTGSVLAAVGENGQNLGGPASQLISDDIKRVGSRRHGG